jgi:site-specific DNA-methyltransferase (adenine-specific)
MIHLGSCLDILPKLPRDSVDLIFTDPPYNIGVDYGVNHNDKKERNVYLDELDKVFSHCHDLLKYTGSIVVVQGDEYAAQTKLLLDDYFFFRQWCIWHYTFGVQCTNKFARSHAHIFYYTVHPREFTFNAHAIRVPSARLTKYADPRANPDGKLPDDVMTFSRVCGTFKEKGGVLRLLHAFTDASECRVRRGKRRKFGAECPVSGPFVTIL